MKRQSLLFLHAKWKTKTNLFSSFMQKGELKKKILFSHEKREIEKISFYFSWNVLFCLFYLFFIEKKSVFFSCEKRNWKKSLLFFHAKRKTEKKKLFLLTWGKGNWKNLFSFSCEMRNLASLFFSSRSLWFYSINHC